MTDDDIELTHSPLTQTYSAEGHTLRIDIYRGTSEPWILEIVDELGTSTVWDAVFESDQAALDAAFAAIAAEGGAHAFVTQAQQEARDAEPALLRKLAQARPPSPPRDAVEMMAPLSDEELDELDQFLLHGLEDDEGMTLDMLDGYLHAIAIGPETVVPSRWLPRVWGTGGTMMPPVTDIAQVNHLLGLVMRHFNSIVSGFEQSPPVLAPCWQTFQTGTDEFEDAESWAHGFTQGVKLSQAAWKPLFDDAAGRDWYRPIGLLGDEAYSDDQDALTRTPAQRAALAAHIEASLVRIHAFWLPLRQAVEERKRSQQMRTKVGRNEPCPCGSGNKFKKCCGAPADLH